MGVLHFGPLPSYYLSSSNLTLQEQRNWVESVKITDNRPQCTIHMTTAHGIEPHKGFPWDTSKTIEHLFPITKRKGGKEIPCRPLQYLGGD